MRKLFVVAALLCVAGIAFASAIRVPFFRDNGDELANGPSFGGAGFIGIINTGSEPVDLTITYKTGSGDDRTPEDNTVIIPGDTALAWRPGSNDPDAEGGGAVVPNMTDANDFTQDPPGGVEPLSGSATISWVGEAGLIQGRYVEITSAGSAFSYLLPQAN